MGECMKDWKQSQVISWIKTIDNSSLSETVKNKIIDGITKYQNENDMEYSGKFLSMAEKDDLVHDLNIGGSIANTLIEIIENKLDSEFEDNNTNNNNNNNNNDDTPFKLNFVGSQAKPIVLNNIRKTMDISWIKSLYLEEYGDETNAHKYAQAKWDKKEPITFKYHGQPMSDNNKKLKDYGCNDGLLPIIVVFKVKGGMNNNIQYTKDQRVQIKVTNNGSSSWIPGHVSFVLDHSIQLEYEQDGITEYKSIEKAGAAEFVRLYPCNDVSNDNHINDKTNDMQYRENNVKNLETGQAIKLLMNNGDWIDATVSYISLISGDVAVKYNVNNKEERINIGKQELSQRIKLNEAQFANKDTSYSDNNTNDNADDNADDNDNKDDDGDYNMNDDNGVDTKDNIDDDVSNSKIEPLKWNEKPMSEWTKNDVKCWMESIPALKRFASDFAETTDGKELLDTTEDDHDLKIILKTKLRRTIFMEKLEAAKQQYDILSSSDTRNENEEKPSNIYSKNQVNGIVGLDNMGNTCYMNTSIQLLSQTPYLSRYLRKRAKSIHVVNVAEKNENSNMMMAAYKITKNCVASRSWKPAKSAWNGSNNYKKMLSAWTDLCDVIYNQSPNANRYDKYTIYKPSDIRDALYNIDQDFGSGEQDDSVRSLIFMLQALDNEIEDELNHNKQNGDKNKPKQIEYMDKFQIFHGKKLSKNDENMVIEKLLNKHNPNNSIIRKSFDGIERIIYECLHCNKILQQYVIFRDLDLSVISNDVVFKNIYILSDNICYKLPQCQLLDYCSMDVLKYEVIQYLYKINNKMIDVFDIDVVTVSDGQNVTYINQTPKISDLQQTKDSIFVLIKDSNNQKNKSQSTSNVLQFVIYIDQNGNETEKSVTYIEYDQNTMYQCIQQQMIKTGNKYNYVVSYNGNVLDVKYLNQAAFKNIHNQKSHINILFLIRADKRNKQFLFDIDNIDASLYVEAKKRYGNYSICDALTQLENWWKNRNSTHCHFNGLPQLKTKSCKDIELKLINIDKTRTEIKKQQYINQFIKKWLNKNFKTLSSDTKKLNNINECLNEYQKTMIVDHNNFAYKCVHCNENCRYTKIEKKIVYTPPILVLHLDRFGKNMKKQYQISFNIGQQIRVKYLGNNTFYSATIKKIEANRIKIHYKGESNDNDEWIYSTNYSQRIQSKSNNFYSSNKFDHAIKYKLDLILEANNKTYNLYGISNHSGTTKGGHYTATIKCLSDNQWYSISDTNINTTTSPMKKEKSATILMYARDQ